MSRLAGMFFAQASATPAKPALVCGADCLTYAELADAVRRLAAALVSRGVREGDAVGVALHNSVEFVVLLLASADLGLVLVPVSPALPPEALRAAFQAAGMRHLVGTMEALRAAETMVPGLLLSAGAGDEDAAFESVIGLIDSVHGDPPAMGRGRDEAAFILTMTSGSTSAPKPILLTQATKIDRAMAAVAAYGVTRDDVTLAATPLYHSLAQRLVFVPLLTGGTAVVMPCFSPRGWIEAVRRHLVSFTIAVSYQLRQIGRLLPPGDRMASLRCVVSSSALLEIETKSRLRAQFGCPIHECYGTSEIGIAASLDLSDPGCRLSSVGRAAEGVDIVILGEHGEPLPPGEAGEIVCRTPLLFGGYFGRPEATRAAMWGDYFRTGDLGRMDEDGYLYFLGRSQEMINTGGVKIYPADVEAALSGYPGIAEAAAFALPDDRMGEVVGLAYVRSQTATFDERQLRHHCGRVLADFQQPHRFVALPALPRTPMGKLRRHVLPQLCGVGREAVPHG